MQILLPDDEIEAFRSAADAQRMTLSDWVRSTLREAASSRSAAGPQERIVAIRAAASHAFPAPDIDRMLTEIEAGYLEGP